MSSILKVAVYDARMQQEEPAYAVQKGALSVSVAPFNAIAASAAQMTFQVLVPSLNVFVDRKMMISAGLNFSANLFYGGPRSASLHGVLTNFATGVTGSMAIHTNVLTLTAQPTLNGAAIVPGLFAGTLVFHPLLPVGTTVIGNSGVPADNGLVYILSNSTQTAITAAGVGTGTGAFGFYCPYVYDVPDPIMGVQQGVTYDSPFDGAVNSAAFQPMGYVTAVSPKDLAYSSFPLQTALTNMTATLNDCTVTTNGDTLKEQLLLTMTPENVKQRTTPSGVDSYSWGRDDANSNSGNFSSYSVSNSHGDVPNGAFPTTWYADSSQTNPLSGNGTIVATGVNQNTAASYPFLAPGLYSFGLGTASGNLVTGGSSGTGFYVAPTNASNVTGFVAQNVLVPFVNNQPVWTTGFPGGDLIVYANSFIGCLGAAIGPNVYDVNPGFTITSSAAGTFITLLRNVPPYCMIGAKLYMATPTGGLGTVNPYGISIGQPGGTPILGVVTNILSGGLGVAGSTYNVLHNVGATGFSATQIRGLALQAGCNAFVPLPVFGRVDVVEPLVISPMIWADSAEFQTVGLYGMTNMQFIMNFAPLGTCYAAFNPAYNGAGPTGFQSTASLPLWVDDLTRPTQNTGNILRSSNIRTVLSDLAFNSSSAAGNGPWTSPTMFSTFLTPGPDVTLPLVSTVPYVEFPRYVRTVTQSFIGTQSVSTQTISLTSIPDMVMLYVKPATKGPSQLDQYIPIDNVQVTFDNFSNLCSGFQQFNLYESAVAAGLDLDWHQWRGFTQGPISSTSRVSLGSNAVTTAARFKQVGVTQLSGGPILLRMGQDITLSPGLAPGCLGNYSFQATVRLPNTYGFYDYLTAVTITVVAINTGFFETVRGQSAIRKTILNSADVESATPETGVSRTQLNRMVGRGAYMRGGSSYVGNASHLRRTGSLTGGASGGMMARHGPSAGMKRSSGIM
jgi:hypothetical protein